MKMAGSSQPMGGLTVGRACIKMAPLKSARKTAHATILVQISFVNCYGLLSVCEIAIDLSRYIYKSCPSEYLKFQVDT